MAKFTHQKLTPVSLSNVQIDDLFWAPKLALVRDITVDDIFDKFEADRGGALNNFDRVARREVGQHAGPPWYDALVYECIRGASDLIAHQPRVELATRLKSYVGRIAAAQANSADGYLHTWVMLLSPETRWGMNGGDLVWQHDIYTIGALVEAAEHYWRATNDPTLLEVAARSVECVAKIAGPSPKLNLIPAHALSEEAFLNLHRLLREQPAIIQNAYKVAEQCLELAQFWVDQRGNTSGRKSLGEYAQDHLPILDQQEVAGHAVRAALLYCGVATLAMATGSREHLATAIRLWDNCVTRRMYVTGGIGSHWHQERMGDDFDLPTNGYLETCAAVAMAYWHHAMFLATADAKYIDELERVLYNGVLVGLGLSGDRYYYTNPLNSRENVRWSWHECPCCPPMLLKVFGSLPTFIYGADETSIFVNLFVAGAAKFHVRDKLIELRTTTRFPWDGQIQIEIVTGGEFELKVRIPGWARGLASPSDLYRFENVTTKSREIWHATVAGRPVLVGDPGVRFDKGFLSISRDWRAGDCIDIHLPMPIERVGSNEQVSATKGLVALQRGPLVYCVEGMDTELGIGVDSIAFRRDPEPSAQYDEDFLGGMTVIRGRALARLFKDRDSLDIKVTAIPYFAQNNRSAGFVHVWMET